MPLARADAREQLSSLRRSWVSSRRALTSTTPGSVGGGSERESPASEPAATEWRAHADRVDAVIQAAGVCCVAAARPEPRAPDDRAANERRPSAVFAPAPGRSQVTRCVSTGPDCGRIGRRGIRTVADLGDGVLRSQRTDGATCGFSAARMRGASDDAEPWNGQPSDMDAAAVESAGRSPPPSSSRRTQLLQSSSSLRSPPMLLPGSARAKPRRGWPTWAERRGARATASLRPHRGETVRGPARRTAGGRGARVGRRRGGVRGRRHRSDRRAQRAARIRSGSRCRAGTACSEPEPRALGQRDPGGSRRACRLRRSCRATSSSSAKETACPPTAASSTPSC